MSGIEDKTEPILTDTQQAILNVARCCRCGSVIPYEKLESVALTVVRDGFVPVCKDYPHC